MIEQTAMIGGNNEHELQIQKLIRLIKQECQNYSSNEKYNLEDVQLQFQNKLKIDTKETIECMEREQLQALKVRKEFTRLPSYSPQTNSILTRLLDRMNEYQSNGDYKRPEAILSFLAGLTNRARGMIIFAQPKCQLEFPQPKQQTEFHQSKQNPFFFDEFVRIFKSLHGELTNDSLKREAIFALQGINGKYLQFDPKSEMFHLPPSPLPLNPLSKQFLLKVGQLATYYMKISLFIQTNSLRDSSIVLADFCKFLLTLKHSYLEFINQIFEQDKNNSIASLMGIYLKIYLEFNDKLQMTSQIIQQINSTNLTNVLYSAYQTDPSSPFLKSLFSSSLHNYFVKNIFNWIKEGVLSRDSEFFIKINSSDPIDYWNDTFIIDSSKLPSFISFELAKKILITGKCLSLLNKISLDNYKVNSSIDIEALFNQIDYEFLFQKFPHQVNQQFDKINSILFQTIDEKYRIIDHLKCIKDTMLLGRGDFSSLLLSRLWPILSKSGKLIMKHSLIGILDDVLRACNFNPLLSDRIDVRLFENFTGDLGWDLFCLEYRVDFPLNIFFPSQLVVKLNRIFLLLWKIQRARIGIIQLKRTFNSIPFQFIFKIEHFLTKVYWYFQDCIITPHWNELITNDNRPTDFDLFLTTINCHFVGRVYDELLFVNSSPIIYQLIESLVEDTYQMINCCQRNLPIDNYKVAIERGIEKLVEQVGLQPSLSGFYSTLQ